MEKVFIIAEAGVNHNGDMNIAKQLIDVAKKAGVDAVKFQTFISEKVVSKYAPKANYQSENTLSNESQLEMVKKLELTFDQFVELNSYCTEVGIEFLSTAFDFESIDFLEKLGIKRWKIPSGDITNLPYLTKVAQVAKPIILSTGMSTLNEVESAISIIRKNDNTDITILHCTTEYPAPYEDINLNAMLNMKSKFNLNVGYSDHSEGIEIAIAAVAMGATIIEKHFTLDKTMVGPDHKASLNPNELINMVKAIRNVEKSLGDGEKKPAKSEIKNLSIARKSIVAKCNIEKGDLLNDDNLAIKRPGNGISPMKWFDIIGTKAMCDFKEDELIKI